MAERTPKGVKKERKRCEVGSTRGKGEEGRWRIQAPGGLAGVVL